MIEINNLTNEQFDKKFLKKVAEKILRDKKQKNKDLSLALIGEKRMRELNRKYRKKNKVTDVLAFSEKEFGLGEVIVCPKKVKENAKKYNSNFRIELARVLVHGILHLLGYDHEKSKKEAQKMKEKENYYLKIFFKNVQLC